MKYIIVKFKGTEKRYIYKARLNLMVGAIYDITADNSKTYNNPVLIEGINEKAPKNYNYAYPMRERLPMPFLFKLLGDLLQM